jgi:predicted AlkP superfamily pyrophosphatase or phosphodiesterase
VTARPQPVVVLDVVGLTPRLLPSMPNLRRLADRGSAAHLATVFPAVTCTVQATFLTGGRARDHGIVGNGWFFRDLGEILLWRQSHALIDGERIWDAARDRRADYRVANVCWWYAMGAATNVTITPRPIYHADGRKSPDFYARPPELHDRLTRDLGPFPLFSYWGPGAGIASSRWIVAAARQVLSRDNPDLLLVYVPHLDYDLQRFGPDGPEAISAARAVDAALEPLLRDAEARDAVIVVLSEYGVSAARRPIHVNRALRRAGLLEVTSQAGMEYLDAMTSRAFAVADHQIAHVYVRDPADVAETAAVIAATPGVAEVLDATGKARAGIDHARSGELIAVAEPDAWFTYYHWLDDARAPDFARTVEIHRKPGYDPAELFMDPADRRVRLRAATALARKAVGLRYTLSVIPLDPSCVGGTHGRLPDQLEDGPMILTSLPGTLTADELPATAVKDLVLRVAGLAG